MFFVKATEQFSLMACSQGFELAPFFVEWNANSPHPSSNSPKGCSSLSLELRTPRDEALRRLLDVLSLDTLVVRDESAQLVVNLKGPKDSVQLKRPF